MYDSDNFDAGTTKSVKELDKYYKNCVRKIFQVFALSSKIFFPSFFKNMKRQKKMTTKIRYKGGQN